MGGSMNGSPPPHVDVPVLTGSTAPSYPNQPAIERLQDLILVRLPRGICLYSAAAMPFLRSLEQAAESLHRSPRHISGVLVLHGEKTDDREITWLHELETEILFSTLVERLDSFRWLLSLIRNSPKPWVFMSASHCLGSTWDLALSCQMRYWFDPNALVGFPEIMSGGFPAGGVLESLSKRNPRTRERWQAKPIYAASEALAEGFIDFCSKASLWEPEATAVFRELLANQPLIGVRKEPKNRRKRRAEYDRTFNLADSLVQRRAALEQLAAVWKTEHAFRHGHPLAWDYCWQLVKERSRIEDPLAFGRLIAHIAARHYLTPVFQAWLRTQVVAASDPCLISQEAAAFRPEITIDLGQQVAPPTEILLRILRKGCTLVFSAPEPKLLSSSLSLIYGRLERALGAPLARRFWDKSVSWYVNQGEAYGTILMQWTPDDHFFVKAPNLDIFFRRLEGNSPTALPGMLEWEGATLPENLRRLLPYVADEALRLGSRPQGLPGSVFLRAVFLDEMIRISRHVEGELQGVTAALSARGWRFAGDDDAWDRFLKTRYDQSSPPSPPSEIEILIPLTKVSGEVGAWKHARALARRKTGELASRRWNGTAVSQHMATFLGIIAKKVAGKHPLLPIITIDHLAYEALGFPQDYGTPIGYINRRGTRRIDAYTKLHWPTLVRLSDRQDP